MKTPQLDERQRLNRGRAGFISFWTVLALLAADMVLTSCGVHWASFADQLLVVIVLGITVFSVLIVLSGAYFGRRASQGTYAVLMGLVVLALLASILFDGAGPDLGTVLMAVAFSVILVAMLVRRNHERRQEDAE